MRREERIGGPQCQRECRPQHGVARWIEAFHSSYYSPGRGAKARTLDTNRVAAATVGGAKKPRCSAAAGAEMHAGLRSAAERAILTDPSALSAAGEECEEQA